ncbi:unnamed protein product [Bursaphelenchus okinawaensis]|uniref:Tyrosine-protein kinase n=1 Tax=Bursaphelenchus okinawaensis TaxID=465554 RepID=A0A811LPG1_9BILA|nr:unnamed protein product [Bursaphelenchus okinawaensis]CAG9125625.1 unnamed protein product [Bursaphelenchus okinawaensis]
MKSHERSDKLENQVFYHGIRNREDVISELEHKGDFAVRASMDNGFPKLVLNVRGSRGPWNLLLEVVEDKYCLRIERKKDSFPTFENVVKLIEYYKSHGLPHGPKLRRGVPRPDWLLRHQALKYDEKADLLGSGNFCSVYRGTLTRVGVCKQVAIKVCHPADEKKRQETHEAMQSMLYEAKIMSKYFHENVIEFMGIACDHPPIRIVLEFCPGGSLEDHLKKDTEIPNIELVLYAFEAARGMRYLQSQRCIHRDLAARNCLISAQGIIKIADFGLSKVAEDFVQQETALKQIPLRWMAPETIKKPPVYLVNSDVWSFGALIYELFTHGVAPYADEKDFKVIAKNIRMANMPDFPPHTPQPIQTLVKEEIWVKEPEKRILFNEIVVFLYNYIEQHMDEFGDIKTMAVNKIKGVKRTSIMMGDKSKLLKEDGRQRDTQQKSKMRQARSSLEDRGGTKTRTRRGVTSKSDYNRPRRSSIKKIIKNNSTDKEKEPQSASACSKDCSTDSKPEPPSTSRKKTSKEEDEQPNEDEADNAEA